jgi:4-methylaminobutanoate oxidase (formaldehyde-forming)
VSDLTAGLPILGLMGPMSRAVLQKAAPHTVFSNEAFPFGTSQIVEIGYAQVRASRITYVGELGWELYIPGEFALHVFEQLRDMGAEFGLTLAGMHAMNACRMEKGYRHWGDDIGVEGHHLEAGLGFAVAWDKPSTSSAGRRFSRQKAEGAPEEAPGSVPAQRTDRLLYREEPIIVNGSPLGPSPPACTGTEWKPRWVWGTSGPTSRSHRTGLPHSRFEIEIAWERYEADARLAPFYDPTLERVKA